MAGAGPNGCFRARSLRRRRFSDDERTDGEAISGSRRADDLISSAASGSQRAARPLAGRRSACRPYCWHFNEPAQDDAEWRKAARKKPLMAL
ncbi:hypothetical protein Aduo_003532 [Ancylostoma duodenale]